MPEKGLSCLLSAMLPVIHTKSPDIKRQEAILSVRMLVNMCLVSIQLEFKQAILNSSGIQEGMNSSVGRHKALLKAEQVVVLAASHTSHIIF